MPQTRIRRARTQDIEAMFVISVAAHTHEYDNYIPTDSFAAFTARYDLNESNRERFARFIAARLCNDRWTYYVAERQGAVMGHAYMSYGSSGNVFLRGIFVDPKAQGMGVGGALLLAIITDNSDRSISLTVIRANKRAIGFYRKYGFNVAGPSKNLFFGARQIVMTRRPIYVDK